MNFGFLYDPQRQLFAIGYRLGGRDGRGPPRPVVLRPARLGSAARQLPRDRQGRRARVALVPPRPPGHQRRGAPVLLSWSATMFEYLMPLLVMRSYPDTLLDESCRMAVRRQIEYGADARRAVGHLRVGLQRRRSARHLSVQGVRRAGPRPEARPRRRARGRAVRDGAGGDDRSGRAARPTCGGWPRRALEGDYGFFDAIDYTPRERDQHDDAAPSPRGHARHRRAHLLRAPRRA